MTVPTEWKADPASECFLVDDAICAAGGGADIGGGTGVALLAVVGVEEAESEWAAAAACSEAAAGWGCGGAKCAVTPGPGAAGKGGGLSGCGLVHTSLVDSCSLSILGRRRT